jgi:hypothetical protein
VIDEADRGEPDDAIPDGSCAEVAEVAEAIAEVAEAIAEDLAAVVDLDRQDILILRTLDDVVNKLRDMTTEGESNRVRFGAERALLAVAERVGRIMRRDLPVDKA